MPELYLVCYRGVSREHIPECRLAIHPTWSSRNYFPPNNQSLESPWNARILRQWLSPLRPDSSALKMTHDFQRSPTKMLNMDRTVHAENLKCRLKNEGNRCGGLGVWCLPRIRKIVGSNPAGDKPKTTKKIRWVWICDDDRKATHLAKKWVHVGSVALLSGTSWQNRAGSWGFLGRGVECHTLILPLGGVTSWTWLN